MANWKSKPNRTNRVGLALVPPLSPSPDPISLAFDAAMVALSFLSHSGSEEANDLVQRYQNPLQNALGTISDHFVAQANTATVQQLYTWANQVKQLGDKFLAVTYNYPTKGEGARRTILGIRNADGQWEQQPPAAPGYLTGLLNNIVNHAREAEMRQGQIGFDWNRLFDFGRTIVDDFTGNGGGYGAGDYYPNGYPNDGPPTYYTPAAPAISTTTLVIGGLLLLLVAPKILKSLK